MWKTLLVLAVAANSFFISPSEGSTIIKTSSSSSARSDSSTSISSKSVSASSTSSSSSSSSNSVYISDNDDNDDCDKKSPNACEKEKKCSKPNEVFDQCPVLCPPRECGVNIAVILCPIPPKAGDPKCKPGCRCMDGFLRNAEGVCVDKDDCPTCKKPNEIYDACPPPCPPQRCDVDPNVIRCDTPPSPGDSDCKPGCRCIDGYVRNNEGICVTREQCPPQCGVNEMYDKCANGGCRRRKCSEPEICINPTECKPGCVCENKYTRADNGTCIPEDQCAPQCGVNEMYDKCANGGCRRRKCSEPEICINLTECKPGCVCENKYTRADNGTCIPEDQCEYCFKPNEYYDKCAPSCPPQTCESIGRQYKCPAQTPCQGACRCVDGYYRNKDGDCVTKKECKESLCTNDERYEECPDNLCTPQSCSQLGFPIKCPALSGNSSSECPGEPGCVCEGDKVRDDDGNCIPKDQCPSCGGDMNAVPGCGINCGRLCSNYKKKNVPCPLICKLNSCDCRNGYVFDDNIGKCVLPENCTPVCGNNEIYSNCSNGGCGPRTCDQLGYKIGCVKMDQKYCVGRCVCEEGYVRNNNGICIPKADCAECGGDPNAVSGCGVNCGRHCSDLNNEPVACIEICYEDGCDCRKGFALDENTGKCVLPKDCTPTCKVNEVFNTCANSGCRRWNCSQPTICIDPLKCEPGCVCENGYSRAFNGTCIPEDQCESQCSDGERYEDCPGNLCMPQKCSQLGFPLNCTKNPDCPGGPGCVCDSGNIRDDQGNCIPVNKCPSCGGDPNAQSGCGTHCGKRCSDYNKKVSCGLGCIFNGCNCKDGFVYDDNIKRCVRPKYCTPVCSKDEVYSDCINGGCQRKNCSQLGKRVRCAKLDLNSCIKGCLCKDGYLRADNGTCIPEDQCKLQCNKPHEYYIDCAPTCPPETCDSIGKKYHCPKQPPDNCEPACRCENGYYRNANGDCVTKEACENCGTDEQYEDCPGNLCTPQTCSELGFPLSRCTDNSDSDVCPGGPGCICIDGTVRDDNGNCIPIDQCPSCGGDPNAESGCSNHCGNQCSDYNKTGVACPLYCLVNGCDCKDGFVYDNNLKQCVRPQDCTPICGNDEVYSDCINGGCQRKNCSQLGKRIRCERMNPKNCIKGCLCKNGYLRADNGTCVPEDKCKFQCNKPHEYYIDCAPTCPPQTCDSIGKIYFCPKQPPDNCEPACRCEDGYYRNASGDCVSKKECNNCGTNEQYEDCPENLCTPQTCSELGFPLSRCTDNSNSDACPGGPGCICIDGTVRDDNGNCIPIDQCPSCGGDPNAQSGCSNHCGNQCSDYNKSGVACLLYCLVNGCDCKDGFVYDNNLEQCVRPQDCTPVCGNNEIYSDCINGGCQRKNCSQLGKRIRCEKMDPKNCIKGCLCKDGYLRADNGTCVPEDQCKFQCNKPHEYYIDCAPTCPPQTCDSIGQIYFCPKQPPDNCKPACQCEDGYYRNEKGDCVTVEECKNCGIDEKYEDCPGSLCAPQKCSELGIPLNCTDNSSSEECPDGPGCVCVDGSVRDDAGNCIPIDQCPSCGGDPNAQSGCSNYCGNQCSDYNKPGVACPLYCLINGCDCKDGFVYDNNLKQCVRPRDCTPTCGDDEIYSDCVNGVCQRKKCSQLGKRIRCKKIDPENCRKGCLCKDGYLRADNGTCVPKDECKLRCNKPHEYYIDCAPTCPPQTCDSIGQVYFCPKQPSDNCKPACRCDDGYYRNANGDCVTKKECKKCPLDEQYVDCPGSLCAPQKCSELGFPLNCSDNSSSEECSDGPGCVCIDGSVRDDAGNCIPIDQCPSCGGDPNAQSGCSNYCGNQCSDYNKPGVACPLYCLINGCDCKDGFVYDNNLKQCVRPQDCTPTCGDDEIYSDCANGVCQRKKCSQLGKRIRCKKISPKKCKKGCLCKDGYLRADNGTCILEDQCKFQCNKPHEYYIDCAPTCPPQTCDSIGKLYKCPKQPPDNCEPACRCEDGYYRNTNGDCVTKEECENCAKDEQYEDCPGNLCAPQKCSELGFPLNCTINSSSGECPDGPGCICMDGSVRDDAGNCIPIDQCPSCGGDPNAQSGCSNHCGNQCSDYNKPGVACPLYCLLNGCDCKDGFVYDNNLEQCVRPQDCTPTCGDDEIYSDCINGVCQRKKCSELRKFKRCVSIDPMDCVKGCLCRDGYLRADNGTCIPKDQCKLQCNKPHEYYIDCAPTCPPQTCDSIGRTYRCPKQPPDNCKPACRCEDGFYRNSNGDCVTKAECKKCSNDEQYVDCSGNLCTPQKCSELGFSLNCEVNSDSGECLGGPGCICMDGNVRDDAGNCIPIDQCPSCGGDPNAESGCSNHCGNQCSDYNKTGVACTLYCMLNGCDCKDGFVYDNNIKRCVRPQDCTPICGNDEIYSDCINGGCQAKNCSELGKPENCVNIDPKDCIKGCLCIDGYLRAINGTCIPKDQCKSQCTQPNEYYVDCAPTCPPQTCDSIGRLYKCPKQPPDNCEPACRCIDGYYRNANGDCVSKQECKQCAKDEQYVDCPDNLCTPQKCSEVGFPVNCAVNLNSGECPGEPGCICIDGSVRDDAGNCIPIDQCPSCGGDPNAQSGCSNYCGNQCSDYNKPGVACPLYCLVNGCDCKDGFVYDNNLKQCVRPRDCTPVCGNDEIYSDCINGGCQAKNCSELTNRKNCVIIDPRDCIKGCLCKNGYLRAINGTCIPKDQCKLQCNKPHDNYVDCAPTCPPQTCASVGKKYLCLKQPPANCEPACRCDDGYYRNTSGDCVTKEECTICGPNEIFDKCPDTLCSPQKCSQLGFPIDCQITIRTNTQCPGKPGCVCVDGYVRDDKGNCIPSENCPSCGGDPNAVSGCGINCGKLCSNYDKGPVSCITICKDNACDCRDGFVLDQNINKCVRPKKCTPICGNDEVYSDCINDGCQAKNCSQLDTPVPCVKIDPKDCIKGCLCKDGYLRADNGTCIPEDQCKQQCAKGEQYVDCPGNLCTPQKCSEVGFPLKCEVNFNSGECLGQPGCICIDGSVRDDSGNCIPIDQCPSCGGDPNAQSGCGNHCGNQCSDYNKPGVACPLYCLVNGCDCKDGFVYDNNLKQCVRPQDCTPVCVNDEIYSDCINGGCQVKNCSELINRKNCEIINPRDCIKGCLCKNGYLRADNGTCIPKDQCNAPVCGDDEIYSDCINGGCQAKNCSELTNRKNCVIIDPRDCIKGCLCKNGYLRAINGTCIPKDQCNQQCNKPHEYYIDCAPTCPPQTCDSIGKLYKCPKQPPDNCEPACRCEDGYYRNASGDCVTKEECASCGPNERYDICPDALCSPQKCSQLGFPIDCQTITLQTNTQCPGKPGCVCIDGYVRDDKGNCIPSKNCPSCGGDPNAVSGCGINCGKLCSNYDKGPVACPKICKVNSCDCRDGFVLDQNINKCVRPKKCTPICGNDEVYSDCINDGCQAKNCDQLDTPVPCVKIDPNDCIKGCLCKNDYLRADNNTCIPEDQCEFQCNKPHEYYIDCAPTCPPQTCDSIGQVYDCPKQPPDNCEPACRCEDGYYRNANGDCVTKKECKKCLGPHEYFACGGACDNVCATLNKQNQTNCPIINIVCNPMCYCEQGYARDDQNVCVPIDECPAPLCADDETYDDCPGNVCKPLICSELGFPLQCNTNTDSGECPDGPGCICDDGKIRDDYGNCIPIDQCPSCGGDSNAQSGCGSNCGRRCSDYNKPNTACLYSCQLNGCDCKGGFVYDDNLKICVRPEDCSPTCGQDEVYSDCTNGGCQAKLCSDLGKSVPCVIIDPKDCVKGCLCKDGYLRADNGTCVPLDQCETICNMPHEYYDACAPTCPPQTCESIGQKYDCPIQAAVCKGACRCEKGYYRNKIGECITTKECKKCDGPHEYFSCGAACDNVCATLYKQNQTNCPIINVKCNPMCYCEAGFARNNKNICIPIDQCPPIKCGDDQTYVQCPAALCEPLTCSEVGFPIACPDLANGDSCPGSPDCVCENKYVKDDAGKCIPAKKCPSCGGDPNAVSGCGDHCGNRCSDYKNKNQKCSLTCGVNACDCKKGYVYDDNVEKCVLPTDCSPICQNNEVYDTCANGGCDKRNCSQLGQPKLCIDPIQCKGGCVCAKGYLRNNNGVCVPEVSCPGTCKKPHEIYDSCPPVCPPQTCESIGKVYSCPFIPANSADYCSGDCRCENGYYRNKIGECISEKDCMKCTGPNEYFSCGKPCDNVCSTLSKQNKTNCPIINKKCTPMCYCEDGYARNKNNICVPFDQCDTPLCPDGEIYNECPSKLCQPFKCSDLGFPINCMVNIDSPNCPGGSGCICDEGKVRDGEGVCIPIDLCPSCGGDPNALSGCGSNCGRRCSDYDQSNVRVACPFSCEINACDCKNGFVYDENLKICVRPEDCTPVCGNDEVYSDCINCGCQATDCSQLGKPIPCVKIDPMDRKKGCLCKVGYLRADNGTCIPQDQCKPQCNMPHEYYDSCAPSCPPQTCESIGEKYNCPIQTTVCQGACRCEDGYYRNNIGECITKKECKKCRGPNEYFSCGGACDNVCATLREQNKTNCPIKNAKCTPMCYCEDGYARNNKDVCIPIDQCPSPKCDDDEKYVKCPAALCEPLTCSQVGFPIACPVIPNDDSCPGSPGCVCKNNNVKNDQGKCISRNKCPSCGGDPNAVSGCGDHSDYKNKNKKCSLNCGTNACDCKKGYVYDDNLGKCVLPNDCSPICTGNEVYNDCINGGCQKKKCSQLGRPDVCVQPKECEKGCLCKDGYLRHKNGTCVPIDQCQALKCDPDEKYEKNPSSLCKPLTCAELGFPLNCSSTNSNPGKDEPACICNNDYVRDDRGVCVPKTDCPSCGGDPNAISGCGSKCGKNCYDYDQKVTCTEPCPTNSCDCRNGYIHDLVQNKCVKKEDCIIYT